MYKIVKLRRELNKIIVNVLVYTMKPDSVELTDTLSKRDAVEKVRSILSKEEVLKILKKIIISERFHLLDYNFHLIDKTNGYFGLYYTLVTLVKLSDRIEKHKLFIKTPPLPSSLQYELMTELNSFGKEVRMYDEIIPEMQGVERGSEWAPKCYFVNEELLVLEDLSVQGYVMPNKYVIFDRDHCALVLKTLAKFHAGSFILEDKLKSKKITLFDMYGDVLGEPLFKESTMSKKSHRSCILGINSVIDLVHQLKEEEKSELKNRTEKWFENIAEILKPSKKYKNIICHRDLWANNFLFKYNANSGGKPEACRLIDMQFICYATPAIDYMFAIHLTTDRDTRNKNEQLFLRIYYETLKKELESEGLDVRDCLEWSTFLQSCKETRVKAIAYALMNLPIMLLDAQVREKLFTNSEFLKETLYNDRSAMLRQQFLNVQPFRERMTDVILEAHESLSNYMEENC